MSDLKPEDINAALQRRKGLLKGDIKSIQQNLRKSDREDPYRSVINAWLALSPDNVTECKEIVAQNKISQIAASRHGESETGAYREGMSLPVGLMRALEKFDPELFSDSTTGKRKRDAFRKLYPQFRRYQI